MKAQLDPDFMHSAFDKVDNWRNFEYDKRILDALASLFHLKAPVTAVYKNHDKLFVSYNVQAEDRIKSQIKLGKNFLITGSVDDLLNFYLLMNVDFIDFIASQCRYEWLKLYQIYQEVNENVSFIEFKQEYIKTKKDLPQNLSKLEDFVALYKKLSSLSQKPFVDLIEQKNKSLKDVNKISDKKIKEKSLEELELSFIQKEKELLFKVASNYKDFYIIKEYMELVSSLKVDKTEFRELLFRPMQDCFKASYFIKQGYKIDDVIILDNKDDVHADTNVVDHFPLLKSFDYVGVSRLACGYCHEYLNQKTAFHRGTHGVIDPQWKMNLSSPQEEDFKESISAKAKKLDKGEEPLQHRKLSFDFFEKDIPFSEGKTLCKLKCDLLGSHNYDISDEYGYYIFTGDGYEQIG